ncbi:MAG TPA: hypothetical protein VK757_05980, partial [Candidatus Acidoferrum sp.]|nr:hypothetical protein [Candidatus Acidoferrum sp.]
HQAEPVRRLCGGDLSGHHIDRYGGRGDFGQLDPVITGAISGVGASRRLTAMRSGVTRQIMRAWNLTIPGAGWMGAAFDFLIRHGTR